MKSLVSFVLAVGLVFPACAETIDVEYSRFYSHVKKLDNEDTQALQFAFGFGAIIQQRVAETAVATGEGWTHK